MQLSHFVTYSVASVENTTRSLIHHEKWRLHFQKLFLFCVQYQLVARSWRVQIMSLFMIKLYRDYNQ